MSKKIKRDFIKIATDDPTICSMEDIGKLIGLTRERVRWLAVDNGQKAELDAILKARRLDRSVKKFVIRLKSRRKYE